MIAAMTMPTRFPPTTWSESAPAVCTRLPGQASVRSPMANSAGSPAPASRPKTTIFHRALRLIQDIVCFPCRSGCCRGLGFGRSDRARPLVVDVVVVDLAAAGPPVDDRDHGQQDDQVDDHAEGAADGVRQGV